jgi:hypothetical protein
MSERMRWPVGFADLASPSVGGEERAAERLVCDRGRAEHRKHGKGRAPAPEQRNGKGDARHEVQRERALRMRHDDLRLERHREDDDRSASPTFAGRRGTLALRRCSPRVLPTR